MGRAVAKPAGEVFPETESGTHPISQRPTLPMDLRAYARSTSGETQRALPRVAPIALDHKRVPSVALLRDEIERLGLDHRQGFLLSLVDGASTVEMILDICGMPEDEAIATFRDLFARSAIVLR
jgi:hypothetical protein